MKTNHKAYLIDSALSLVFNFLWVGFLCYLVLEKDWGGETFLWILFINCTPNKELLKEGCPSTVKP